MRSYLLSYPLSPDLNVVDDRRCSGRDKKRTIFASPRQTGTYNIEIGGTGVGSRRVAHSVGQWFFLNLDTVGLVVVVSIIIVLS